MKEKVKSLVLGVSVAACTLPLNLFATEGDTTVMFGTALDSMKSDVMGMIAVAVPVGFAIFGATIAIKKGMSFIKTLVNKA